MTVLTMLKQATVRLEILEGRMRACTEEAPDAHQVSLLEIPGWLEEQRQMIRMLEHMPEVTREQLRGLSLWLDSKIDALYPGAEGTLRLLLESYAQLHGTSLL